MTNTTANSIFAISDPHLSFASDKPMDVFGGAWKNHAERLVSGWREAISEDDFVIVAGDISWALKMEDAIPDLDFLHNLPGTKLLIRGNHDLWWQSVSKLNALHPDMIFLQNDRIFLSGALAVCGSRGWGLPGLEGYGADDEKILARELIRLKLSLDKAVSSGAQNIICALHFPPALAPSNHSPFTDLIEKYPVSQVVYGHLHGSQAFRKGISGERVGIRYNLVTCDYLNFKPLRII